MRRYVWTILAALVSEAALAEGFWDQFKDPDDGRFDTSAFLADNAYGFLPLPIIITDPAANSYGEFKDAPSRNAKGAGFRYLVAKRYGFEMGVDIARGPEEDVFYIQGGTAW